MCYTCTIIRLREGERFGDTRERETRPRTRITIYARTKCWKNETNEHNTIIIVTITKKTSEKIYKNHFFLNLLIHVRFQQISSHQE